MPAAPRSWVLLLLLSGAFGCSPTEPPDVVLPGRYVLQTLDGVRPPVVLGSGLPGVRGTVIGDTLRIYDDDRFSNSFASTTTIFSGMTSVTHNYWVTEGRVLHAGGGVAVLQEGTTQTPRTRRPSAAGIVEIEGPAWGGRLGVWRRDSSRRR